MTETLTFSAYRYGFHARVGFRYACFLEPRLAGQAILWYWVIRSDDMLVTHSEGICPTPAAAEAAVRAWLKTAG